MTQTFECPFWDVCNGWLRLRFIVSHRMGSYPPQDGLAEGPYLVFDRDWAINASFTSTHVLGSGPYEYSWLV